MQSAGFRTPAALCTWSENESLQTSFAEILTNFPRVFLQTFWCHLQWKATDKRPGRCCIWEGSQIYGIVNLKNHFGKLCPDWEQQKLPALGRMCASPVWKENCAFKRLAVYLFLLLPCTPGMESGRMFFSLKITLAAGYWLCEWCSSSSSNNNHTWVLICIFASARPLGERV